MLLTSAKQTNDITELFIIMLLYICSSASTCTCTKCTHRRYLHLCQQHHPSVWPDDYIERAVFGDTRSSSWHKCAAWRPGKHWM